MVKPSDIKMGNTYYWFTGYSVIKGKIIGLPAIHKEHNVLMVLINSWRGYRHLELESLFKTKRDALLYMQSALERATSIQKFHRDNNLAWVPEMLKSDSLNLYKIKRRLLKET